MIFARRLYTVTALACGELRVHRGQAAYLVLTLAITVAVWLILAVLAVVLAGGTADDSGAGITIGNASQTSGALPLSYARRIESIRGTRDVFWYGIQVVKCAAATTVQLDAVGGPGADALLAKQKVPAAMAPEWNAAPLGVVISQAAADKCGWRVGQGVDPPTVVFDAKGNITNAKPVELHVTGIFPGSFPLGFAHYDYINRAAPGIQGKDKVVTYFASARDPRGNEALAARIEAVFAHDFPALAATTNATVQNAWSRFGKVQQLLVLVMAAVLLCAASVLVSVLAHAAAQRRPWFAVLQVLGFQRITLFGAFALEVLAIVVVGALLGVGLAALTAHLLVPTTLGYLSGGAQVPAWAWWGLPVWLVILAVMALVWPAGLIARVRPADYRAV